MNVTICLNVKSLRDFLFFCFSICRNAKFSFGQFNGRYPPMILWSRSYWDFTIRYFVILETLVPKFPKLQSLKCRFAEMALTSVSPLGYTSGPDELSWYDRSPFRGFVTQMHDHLVSWLPKSLFLKCWWHSLARLSRRATCPLKIDGPRHFTISRLATPNPLSTWNPSSQNADSFLDLRQVSKWMDSCDLFGILGLFLWSVVTLRQQDLRYPELWNAEMMALRSAATCPLRWMPHNPLGISRYMMLGFCVSGFWRAVSFAHPTSDPRFFVGIRSMAHDFLWSNGPE
jgi:hypothetical protein